MTKFKFSEKYKMIDRIKRKLKKNPDVTIDQIKSYNRRALGPSGAFLMTHIDMIEELNRDKLYYKKKYEEERAERQRLEGCLSCKKINRIEKLIIETYSEKSYEYQQVFLIEEFLEEQKKREEISNRVKEIEVEIAEAVEIGETRMAEELKKSLLIYQDK